MIGNLKINRAVATRYDQLSSADAPLPHEPGANDAASQESGTRDAAAWQDVIETGEKALAEGRRIDALAQEHSLDD